MAEASAEGDQKKPWWKSIDLSNLCIAIATVVSAVAAGISALYIFRQYHEMQDENRPWASVKSATQLKSAHPFSLMVEIENSGKTGAIVTLGAYVAAENDPIDWKEIQLAACTRKNAPFDPSHEWIVLPNSSFHYQLFPQIWDKKWDQINSGGYRPRLVGCVRYKSMANPSDECCSTGFYAFLDVMPGSAQGQYDANGFPIGLQVMIDKVYTAGSAN